MHFCLLITGDRGTPGSLGTRDVVVPPPGMRQLAPAGRQPPARGAAGVRGTPGRKLLTSARFSCVLGNMVFKGEKKGAGVIVTACALCQAARMLPKITESLRCLLKTPGIIRCKRTSLVQR